MPIYSTSSVNVSGNTGSIVVSISDSIGGGDVVTSTFDVAVSLESSSYNFTGGNPAASSTFGNNGARWNGLTYTSGNSPTTVTYNWSRTVNTATDYVVVLLNRDGTLYTHWGHIPAGISGWTGSGASPISERMPDDLREGHPTVEFTRDPLPRPPSRPTKKGPIRPGIPR